MLGIFLDTETSGLNPFKHSVLELAYKMVDLLSGKELLSFESMVAQPKEIWQRADPNSLKVNGITWEKVSQGISPEEIKKRILADFTEYQVHREKAIFICQNPSFDRAFFSQLIDPDLQESLEWPYHWLDLASMYWATQMDRSPLPWETGVSKDKISAVYQIAPEEKPHRAINGVDHLLLCYEAVVGFPQKVYT